MQQTPCLYEMDTKRAVIYARFSSSRQREESIEGQVRECKYFAEHEGYTILNVYADHAISGRTDEELQNIYELFRVFLYSKSALIKEVFATVAGAGIVAIVPQLEAQIKPLINTNR